jgi:hypothetical protein
MTEQRIRELEAENNRYRAMLRRAGVSLLPAADLPNVDELDRLIRMVATKYPCLKCPAGDEPAYREQMARAMSYLVHVYRKDTPDTEHAVSFWIDNCRDFLAAQGINARAMTIQAFVTAAVASGIVHEPLDQFPYGINLGISLGSASRPSDAWRSILKNGVPQPVAPKYGRQPKVQQLNMIRETVRW